MRGTLLNLSQFENCFYYLFPSYIHSTIIQGLIRKTTTTRAFHFDLCCTSSTLIGTATPVDERKNGI